MKNIAVIGSGTMGNGIAHVFAQFGYKVALIDISQASLDKAINLLALESNADFLFSNNTFAIAAN